ncbi:MAG TPA: hypothetical protein VHC69_29160 [Polyangiaceae bacterium]|nr:hypothetical protein [Polyangiaceae bacterium]
MNDVAANEHAAAGLLGRENAEACEFQVTRASERTVVLAVVEFAGGITIRASLVTQEQGERFREDVADAAVAISNRAAILGHRFVPLGRPPARAAALFRWGAGTVSAGWGPRRCFAKSLHSAQAVDCLANSLPDEAAHGLPAKRAAYRADIGKREGCHLSRESLINGLVRHGEP